LLPVVRRAGNPRALMESEVHFYTFDQQADPQVLGMVEVSD